MKPYVNKINRTTIYGLPMHALPGHKFQFFTFISLRKLCSLYSKDTELGHSKSGHKRSFSKNSKTEKICIACILKLLCLFFKKETFLLWLQITHMQSMLEQFPTWGSLSMSKKEIHPCMTTVLSVSLVMKIFSQRCTIEFFNGLAF